MLQVSYIRNNKEHVIERLAIKNFKDAKRIIENILKVDRQYREAKLIFESQKGEIKLSSSEIARIQNYPDARLEVLEKKKSVRRLRTLAARSEKKILALDSKLKSLLYTVPNLPNSCVPAGKLASDNIILLEKNKPIMPLQNAKPHWELASQYNLIDFELGVKVTGAGFPVYKGKAAKLQRALISFFLDEAEKAGYQEVMVPHLVNESSGIGTGQLPDKEDQMYYVGLDKLYLIPTAEVPITNLFRDVILKAHQLPAKNCGYTPCFRREAGSYGADVRGLNRLHQFDKVELVQIVHPQASYQAHHDMCFHVQSLLEKLQLPYRILRLCGGDMSFASALTHDFETWSAAQEKWLEVSSVSNFETFQSNRLNLKFKNDVGKNELAHTLNGSALALPRIVATLLENNQTEKGIKIPEVLVPYTRFEWID
jgi:seryl-tRNA synthetase